MKAPLNISVIIPVYNEGSAVHTAYDLITSELSKHNETYEMIFVDDGSADDSFYHLKTIADKDEKVKVLKFLTNCGSHMAIRAGLSYANSECACFIACDMQEPPDLIYKMKARLSEQHNIIWAVRSSRKDQWSTRVFATIFYWLARHIVTRNIPPSGASMFMVSAKVLRSLRQYYERNLTLEGLFATMGYKSEFIYYNREERKVGQSKWTISKKIKLFIDFFIAYSNTPIRFVSVMGILFSIFGFLWTIYILLREIFVGDLTPGWPALISILLIGFGITNISLGIIAEYLWRTLDEARKRPNYIIDQTVNISGESNL